MVKRFRVSRNIRSWACANIIHDNNLFGEFKVFCYSHPKVKSKYRAANLFLMHKGLLYKIVDHPIKGLNMDNLEALYYE